MRKKKVLICGASGFIGRNLFETLSKRSDLEVYGTCFRDGFNDDRLSDLDLTIRYNARVITRGADVVIHAAAVTAGSDAVESEPEKYIADNLIMNTLLAEAVHINKVSHFIFLSCMVVYPSSNTPLKERDADPSKVHPRYRIGAQIKISAEELCFSYSELKRTKYTMIRPSNVYGPHDKFSEKGHMLDITLAKALHPETTEISILGHGSASRDFMYVSDLVSFIEIVY